MGLTDDRLLLLEGSCPVRACTLAVVSFEPSHVGIREVQAPRGWTFAPTSATWPVRGELVPVVPLGSPIGGSSAALARVAAGGDSAVLVAGTDRYEPQAGVVERDGDVFFVSRGISGTRRVLVWAPATAGQVSALGAMPPLPAGARLVCVCAPVRGG